MLVITTTIRRGGEIKMSGLPPPQSKILIKRGSTNILTKYPSDRSEPVFITDKHQLFIGLGNGDHVFIGGKTNRKLKLSGDVVGEVGLDGNDDITLNVTVSDDSHKHTIPSITGLSNILDNKSNTNDVKQMITDAIYDSWEDTY